MRRDAKDLVQRETMKRITDSAKRIADLETLEPPNTFVIIAALNVNGITFRDDGGNFGAKILDGGGFTRFSLGDKGEALFESVSTSNNCLQLQMTRATATTVVRGFSARVTMVGRVGGTFTYGLCDLLVQGRNNQSIQYAVVNNNVFATTVITQTSTDLTLKFDCGGVSWTELTTAVVAFAPVHAGWTITGSLVA